MNFREKIRYLKQYLYCVDNLKSLLDEREKWFTIGTKVNSVSDGMPHSSANDSKVEKSSIKILELTQKIDAEVERLTALRDEIETAIESVPDLTQRTVLHMIYINGYSFAKVGDLLSKPKTERQVHNIRNAAIENMKIRRKE